jgi:tetratricopeptide (TPR) repeat protein
MKSVQLFRFALALICAPLIMGFSHAAAAAADEGSTSTATFKLAVLEKPDAELTFPFSPDTPLTTEPFSLGNKLAAPVLFVAPFGKPGTQQTSATNTFRELLRFHLTPGSFADAKWVNILPDTWTEYQYSRSDHKDMRLIRDRATYIRDAKAMQANFYLDGTFEVTTSGLHYKLFCCNLDTDSAKTFEAATKNGWSPALIRNAVENVAHFCGLSDSDIEKSALLEGLPGKSWEFLVKDNAHMAYEFEAAAKSDPECRFLYRRAAERAGHGNIDLLNKILKKYPEEPRLLFAKSWATNSYNYALASGILQLPLVKRWPQCFVYSMSYVNSIKQCYEQGDTSQAPPEEFTVVIGLLESAIKLWPQNWALYYESATARLDLAFHVRGNPTMDKVNFLSKIYMGKMIDLSMADILKAVELRNDSPLVLRKALAILFQAGHNILSEEKKLLDLILEIDPSDTAAEDTISYAHSAGWDNPVVGLQFIQERVAAREGNPDALSGLLDDYVMALRRLDGFKYVTEKELFTPDNSLMKYCVTLMDKVVLSGGTINREASIYLIDVLPKIGLKEKVTSLAESLRQLQFTVAYVQDLFELKKYKAALELALKIQNRLPVDWEKVTVEEIAVLSLIHLKRTDEAVPFAEKALREYPDNAICHHMLARALESEDKHLDRALLHAKTAALREPDNKVMKNTYKRLKHKVANNTR